MILHGIADSRLGSAGFAGMFLRDGYSVLLPDSRGHGRSGGEFVTYGLQEKYDVQAWAAWLRGQGCRSIYGLGESLGAAILIQAAALGPDFRAVVAECAYSDLRSIAEYRLEQISPLPAWVSTPLAKLIIWSATVYARLLYHLDLSQVRPIASIAQTWTPILLIHGLADWRTPPWHSQALARASPHAELWLVPGAAHTAAAAQQPEEFRKRVLGWFARH